MPLAAVLGRSFDTSALTDPIDRDDLVAYRRGLPRPLGRSRAWTVAWVIGSTASFVFLIAFWGVVIGEDRFAGAGVADWMVWGTGGLIYLAIPTLIIRTALRDWASAGGRWHYRLDRFARANGMAYSPVRSPLATPLPGILFAPQRSALVRDMVVQDDASGFIVGNATVRHGAGSRDHSVEWGFAGIKLGRRLPHIVLDATGNNSVLGRTSLPIDLDPRQRLSLEGDFDRHFTLHCPRGYEQDALYLLTPDIMARFIDNAAAFDVEIVEDRLFLYARRPLATTDPATWEWMRETLHTLTVRIDQWHRWRDDRVGSTRVERGVIMRPPRGVAPAGRRLTEHTPWWVIVGTVTMLAFAAVGIVVAML